jgi:CubicO group peptidase (beta-lactamase class C family)
MFLLGASTLSLIKDNLQKAGIDMNVKRRKKKLIILYIVIAVTFVAACVFFLVSSYRMNQIPQMTVQEMLSYTTKNNDKAVITVGMIQKGKASYTVYGSNGSTLKKAEHTYEIGSLSKTFTASLLYQTAAKGKIDIDDSLNKYLNVPEKESYPTIKQLITHTSGYKGYYVEPQMISNFLQGKNDFYGISTKQLTKRIGKLDLENKEYGFKYSNFGYAVVGAILSEVWEEDFSMLLNNYISKDLGLQNTYISDGNGDLENYWDWSDKDAYLPAGALTSTIEDMLKYAQLQMEGEPQYLSATHSALAEIDATSDSNAKLNIHMDSIGAGWIIDKENNIIWHNGGTDNYNCYLGFDPDKQLAVVVLSNLSPNYRIPATVMGVKVLTDLQEESN